MATNLGELYYALRIKDLTQQDIDAINNKLRNLGGNIQINAADLKTAFDNATRNLDMKIGTVSNLKQAIDNALGQQGAAIKIDKDAFDRAFNQALAHAQANGINLQFNTQNIRSQIMAQLANPFEIQIKVIKDQARQAVQNALNQATNISDADALKYSRLMRGENQAALAELNRLRAAHYQARDAANAHASASIKLGGALGSNIRIAGELGAAMASLYSVHQIKEFLSNVVEIGGELEHQKIALDTIYGDPGKTTTLFNQIKGLARQSPFGVMDLTKNIKQLSAYGVAYNEVYDTAKRLADISAATSVDINRLILAFGKTKNRTFLDGLEAKQFAYANIPIYDALSKKLTELEGKFVSVKDVMGRIKKREIGFDMVKEILWDMTDEGGKFFNMQEKLAGSVKTSWKLVRDNIELMFGEIAESSVGDMLKDLAQILQNVTKHWQSLAAVLGSVGAIWGMHRLAVFGLSKAVDAHTKGIYSNLVASKQKQVEEARAAAITGQLTQRQKELLASTNRLTAAELQLALANQQLDATEIKRLYLSGQISKATMQELVAMNALTQAQHRAIVGGNLLSATWIKVKTSLAGLGATMKSAMATIINPTTAIFAAIGGAAYLWQKNTAETDLGNEINKQMKERGEGMAKALAEGLEKPFKDLTGPAADTLITEYKNLIKDYATLPDDLIANAVYDKDGNIRNTADQIKYLREELEKLKNVANQMESKTSAGSAISATGDGWLKEDVVTNIKDWISTYDKADATYRRYVKDYKNQAEKMVEIAIKTNSEYAKEVQNAQNLSEKFLILAHNRDKYRDAWSEIVSKMGYFAGRGESLLGSMKIWNPTVGSRQNEEFFDRKQMREDVQSYAEYVKDQMEGLDMSQFENQELARQYFNALIERAGATGKEMKEIIATEFKSVDFFKDVQLIEDETKGQWMNDVRKVMEEFGDEGVEKLIEKVKIDGWDKLSETEKMMLQDLFSEADNETQKKLPELFDDWQSWINQHDLLWRIKFFFSSTENQLSQAAKDLIDQNGDTDNLSLSSIKILRELDKEGSSVYDIRNAAQQELQKRKNKLDADIKQGIKETSESFKADKASYDEMMLFLKEFNMKGLQTKDQKSNRQPQKDTIAEEFKQQFKDLKDAWSEYKKWEKSVGDDAAADVVANSGLFGKMDAADIPRTVEEYQKAIEKIEDELRKAGIEGHTQRESLLNDILKTLLDVKKTIVDEQIEKALAVVDEEIEKKLQDWDLYEKIRKATGNKDLAYTFSFGLDEGAQTDYVQLMKDNFNRRIDAMRDSLDDVLKGELKGKASLIDFDFINRQNVTGLPDELRKAWEEAVKNIRKYQLEQRQFVADLLGEYQSAQDRITAIQAKAAETIGKIWQNPDLTDPQKRNLATKVKTKADYESFTQSADYLQFFGGVLAMTEQEAENVGAAIRKHLDEELQAGVITAEEYYKEIERIEEQLWKIRNVRGNAMTFMTEGLSGLYGKQSEQNDAERLKKMQEIERLEDEIAKARERGDKEAEGAASIKLMYAKKELANLEKIGESIKDNIKFLENLGAVTSVISNVVNGVCDAFGTLREMAGSLGFDTESDDWLNVGAVLDTFQAVSDGLNKTVQGLMNGDIGGAISGVASMLMTPVTIWAQLHDRKLQKDIEASERLYDKYQSLIDGIEGRFEYFLGNRRNMEIDLSGDKNLIDTVDRLRHTGYSGNLVAKAYDKEYRKARERIKAYEEGGALGYERQLMTEQLDELERQRRDYEQMKGDHSDDIEDVTQQIEEQRQAIRDFAYEMANITYGIDISDWAGQIGDALVGAFAKGEDAAEAFKNTVNDIMRDVVSNVITQNIIAPAMQDMQDWLFGKDGQGGAYGQDFWLDENNVADMYSWLGNIEDAAERAWEFMEKVDDMTGGRLKSDDEGKDSKMRVGIQSVTEDTADLLASYVNAIRAYAAQDSLKLDSLVNEAFPKLNLIAEGQLQQLTMIAENTRRNMEAAEIMQASVVNMEKVLSDVTAGRKTFNVR